MKKSLQSLVLLLMVLMVPVTATATYEQLAEGVYMDGTTLYISSDVTSLGDLLVNPSEIYCYATIPPACLSNTFASYDATLHVPAAGMVSYFTTLYWYNFNNILSDAIEPLSVTMNNADAELEISQQLSLSATVAPGDATPKTVYWSSTDASVATVSSGGTVTAVATGECDIIATCVDKVAVCHVTVVNPRVTITFNTHEARLLPNHTITLTATCSPIDVDLAVTSSNPGVAIPRLVNGAIMVVGVAEGTATITVNAADGNGNPDSCVVTVYTEPGDVNSDGYVNISDVTALIDYLLSGNPSGVNLTGADCNDDGSINISDVTTLIDFLLSGKWPWQHDITFNVNGVTFKMIYVDGGTFTMGATAEQGSEADNREKPAHQVNLSSYLIAETEVTQELWLTVMGSNPSYFSSRNNYTEDLKRPVECVSWNDCQKFIAKLNQMTGMHFRLPTEAEWEFAARGGSRSHGYKYAGSNTVREVAWYWGSIPSQTSGTAGWGAQAVATKHPNELGLYDMSGNVSEWVNDWYDTYSGDVQTNPTGPTIGTRRVFRSGSWNCDAWACRVSYRYFYDAASSYFDVGLRLTLDEEKSSNFHLSETVLTVMPGERKSVDILNGDGDYTLEGESDNASITISGNSLTVKGINEGTSAVYVINTSTGATAVLTIIVDAEHEYVDLGLPSGTLWATMNIGASCPEDFGDYFAWGETDPKDLYDDSTYKWCSESDNSLTKYCTDNVFGTVDNKSFLDPQDDAAFVNWGPSWRIPSSEQQDELVELCTWTWTTRNGVNGQLVTGPNGNTLFLPAAGFCSPSSPVNAGLDGCYWSRTVHFTFPTHAYGMYFDSEDINCHESSRRDGQTVRAVRGPKTDFYVEQQSLDFGLVSVGLTCTIMLTIVNNSVEDLTLTATSEEPFSFKQGGDATSCVTIEVPSQSSSLLMVLFDGTTLGDFNGNVIIQESTLDGGQIVVPIHALAYASPNVQQGYVDLDLPSGTLWATMNVGANSPEEYGDYFAWGETSSDDSYTWSTYRWSYGNTSQLTKYCTLDGCGTFDNLAALQNSDDAAYVNWGSDWRMPTVNQLKELRTNCNWHQIAVNGVNGYLIIGNNFNTIFLPATGYMDGSSLKNAGSNGYFWSRELVYTQPYNAYYAYFDSNGSHTSYCNRDLGLAVRAVRR